MSTEIAIALIGLAGGVITGAASAVWGPVINQRFERRRRAAEVRDRYSPPLLQAAFDLQSRLYNIVRQGFLEAYLVDDKSPLRYAENSTLWLIAQYLGWGEILRREVQFLDFGQTKTNRSLQEALGSVTSELASDAYGHALAVFRAEQRAIGELMIVGGEGADASRPTVTLGYADFVRRLTDADFGQWFEMLSHDLNALPQLRSYERLISVQRALVDVVDLLDSERVRYPNIDTRGKLPLPVRQVDRVEVAAGERLARFIARPVEYGEDEATFPRGVLADWARRHDLELLPVAGDSEWKAVGGSLGAFGARLMVHLLHRRLRIDNHAEADSPPFRIEIYAAVESPQWAQAVRLVPARMSLRSGGWRFWRSRRRAREILNDLLERLARPTVQ